MLRGATQEGSDVEIAAEEWNRKAVTVFSWASALAYLPVVALMVGGQVPPNGWPAHAIAVLGYLSFAFCALPHRMDYRARTWVLLAAGYVVALLHIITIPHGPFGRALPAMLPILAIVLLGSRPGWTVTAVSVAMLLLGPFLQRVPGLVETLTTEPSAAPVPTVAILDQGAVLTALLVGQMILLDRFHRFLMRSLKRSKADAAERSAAHCRLEREMAERGRLERELARVGDEERHRLGLEMHDGICQQLAGALLRCEALSRRVNRGQMPAAPDFEALASLLEEAIDEAHATARGLSLLEPDPEALPRALRALAKRTQGANGVTCSFNSTGDVSIAAPSTAQHLYRIAQEAVSNAVRHAHATRINIELRGSEDGLRLQVEDNGDGLSVGRSTGGMGLRTMAYRAHLLEGGLTVTPAPAGGTRVACRVPHRTLARPDHDLPQGEEVTFAG